MSTVNATEYVAHPDKKVNDGRSMWDLLKGETSSAPAAPSLPKPSVPHAPVIAPATPSPWAFAAAPPPTTPTQLVASDSSELDGAVSFLVAIASGGKVALASCVPDGPMRGAILDPVRQRSELKTWLRERNGRENVYYTINEPKPAAERTGKSDRLKKSDVAAIRGLAVDVDPKRNVDLAMERARLLDMARGWQEHWLTPPTAIVDTGGGIQMLWLLREALPNTEANLAAVEAQAKALGRCVESDRVQSLEHLFRVPGLRNLPTRKKRELGRDESVAGLLHFDSATRYTLDTLATVAAPAFETPRAAEELDGLDYAEVIAAAEGEPLPARLATALTEMRKRRRVDTALANTDRSARDFALAACCVEYGLTNPTDIGRVAFSLSPDKLLEKDGQGYGESYAAGTIRRSLAATKPRVDPRAEDFLTGTPAALSAPAAQFELRVVTGMVDAQRLPVRDWLIRPRLPIGDVTQAVGEPSIGKSTFAIRDALIVTTGREDLLRGKDASGGPITYERLHRTGAAVIYNSEDRLHEMEKRLAAIQRHFGITNADMKHPIVLWSGVDMSALKIMERDREGGSLRRAPGADLLEQVIRQYDAVFVCLDPQISLAAGAVENSSEDQNDLLQELASIAARHKVNISVVHHTGKQTRGDAGDMGAGRGAFAAVAKVRSAYTITNVTGERPDEKDWGVAASDRLVRLDMSKTTNDSKPAAPFVFRRVSAAVGNGSGQLPQGVSDMFEASPQARLEAEGDFAAVVDVVDMKARIAAAKTGADSAEDAEAKEIATMADALLGDADKVKLADLRDALGAKMNAARIGKGTSRNAINERVMKALLGGCEIEKDGQSVLLCVERAGKNDKAAWHVVRKHRNTSDIQSRATQ